MQRPSSSILANIDSILFPVNGQDIQQRMANDIERRSMKTVSSLDVQAYINGGSRVMDIEYAVYWAITENNLKQSRLNILLPSFQTPVKTMQVSIYHTRSELFAIHNTAILIKTIRLSNCACFV